MGLVTSLLERRQSIEDPRTPLAAIFDLAAGRKSKAGPRINEANAETLAAFWCGVRVLSESVASLPLLLFRRLDNGGRERATDHHIYSILRTVWNPLMPAFTGKEMVMRHAVGWGNSFHEIQRRRNGEIAALWPLLPDRTSANVVNDRKFITTRVGGDEITLKGRDVLHIPGPGFDGVMGKSVVRLARESLGLTSAAEEFGSRFFGNGANASGALEHPSRLGPEAHERLKSDFEKKTTGIENAHRPMILEEGMKFNPFSIPPDDAQFLETRKFQVTEVARWLNLPPHKLKDMERATFTNIESQNREFLTDSLKPWLTRIEEGATLALLTEQERETYFIEFVTEGFLRGDSTAQAEFFTKMFNIGTMSQNDIRAKLNENPIDDGDTYYVPLNMVPADQAGTLIDDPPPEGASIRTERRVAGRQRQRQAHMPVFVTAFHNVLNRELTAGRRALKRAFGERTVEEFQQWVEEFYQDYGKTVTERLLPVLMSYGQNTLQAVAAEMGQDEPADGDEFIRDFANRLGIRWSASSRKQLRDLIRKHADDPESLQDAVTAKFDHWHDQRAEQSARDETVRAGEALTVFGYAAAGVVTIAWVLSGGGCPLCEQMSGRTVGITQSFASQGDVVNPSDGSTALTVNSRIGHPPLHRGCDCAIVPG